MKKIMSESGRRKMAGNLSAPLLGNEIAVVPMSIFQSLIMLIICLASSGAGMIALKFSQVHDRVDIMVLGYILEAIAFGIYPFCLKVLSLRLVVVSWSATSNIVAFSSSILLFHDPFSWLACVGCMCNILGVVLVTIS